MNIEDSVLPYIHDPKSRLKILIDTGSTKSFINKNLAFKLFKQSINSEPFIVSTAHGESREKYSCKIPILGEEKIKFYLFNFHQNFDLLLGLDNMKQLELNINLVNNIVNTKHMKIPILYFDTEKFQFKQKSEIKQLPKDNKNNVKNLNATKEKKKIIKSFLIQSRSKRIIELEVKNIQNGQGLMSYVYDKGLEIPQCLVKVKNGKMLCPIINTTMKDIRINPKPLKIESLNNYEIYNTNNKTKINANCNLIRNKKVNNKLDFSKIRMDHMNLEEKNAIKQLVKEYSDIFYKEGNDLTFTNQVKHTIRTSDEIPVYTRSYRYPEVYKKEINTQIHEMLKQKIIRNSKSPWNSPVWIVPKKMDASGKQKFRMVIDFRNLNSKTIDDKYPLPNITDILDKLGRSQYFTTLDLANGFHQIEMDQDSIEKTAFSTENGHYEFLRMPFGLKNSPPTFQRVMNNILRGLQNEICLVYLDDIIIYSTSLQEHINRLKEVFERLRKANFKIQMDKTEFLRKEVGYLGHIVTPNGVKPNPEKIKIIKNYPIPKTVKQIKSFLGLIGYYRKFIKDFAKLTKPFTKCLKKGEKIDIENKEYLNCFEQCKNILCNEPILQYPDFSKEFILTTDASNFALGAILSQETKGKDLPIAYASRTLNNSECNYSTIEKELLAIVWATQYFRPYLYGKKFKVYTDHKPLQWLFSVKEPTSKLLRWRLKLEEYDYEVKYKKGKNNQNVDALSRIQLNITEKQLSVNNKNKEDELRTIEDSTKLYFPELDDLEESTFQPLTMGDNESIIVNVDEDDDQTIHSNYNGNVQIEIPISEEPVNFGKNQIILSLVKNNPKKVIIQKLFGFTKMRLLVEISETNFEKDIIEFVKAYLVPKVRYNLYFEQDFYEQFVTCMAKNFMRSELNLVRNKIKLLDVLDSEEIKEIINNYHTSKTNHRGINETCSQIKRLYYWPNINKSVQDYVNECDICLQTKYERNPLRTELSLTPTASKPLEIVSIDTVTFDKTKFLTVIDSFSKHVQLYEISSSQATEICDKLLNHFATYKIPSVIISDNGTEFNNKVIKELMDLHKIKIHYVSTQHPQSNGLCERVHSTIIEHIRLLNNQLEFKQESISRKVKFAVIAYNNSIHSVTKLTPNEVLYGHINNDSILEMNLENKIISDYVNSHKEKTIKLYDHIRDISTKNKENIVNKRNATKEVLPENIPQEVYVKTVQKQSKTKNKYNKEKLISVNRKNKTAQIEARHPNTKGKIHLSNIKRPRKSSNNKNVVPGTSPSLDM